MIEKITLRIFLSTMVLCASLFIIGIWLKPEAPETLFKTTATLFIVGFGNALAWGTTIVYRFLGQNT